MENTGNTTNGNSLSTLAERIRAKTEQDRQEIEALTRQQFNSLSENLNASSKNALSSTEVAIQAQLAVLEKSVTSRCAILNWMFGKRFLQALFLSFALFLGLTFGGWSLIQWETSRILSLRKETAQLQSTVAALEKTAAQWEAKTWGLELTENDKGRFIIIPAKITIKTGWTLGNRQAIKLE